MPCWHRKPYSGREHTVFILIQSGNDDGEMEVNETENRKPLVALYDMPGLEWTILIKNIFNI